MSQITQESSLDAFHLFSSGRAQRLKEVWERVGSGCRHYIVLRFTYDVLAFKVNEDEDTIDVRCTKPSAIDFSDLRRADPEEPWCRFMGKSLTWGWVAVNQQGYQDGVLLSFDYVMPSVMLCVAASSAEILLLSQAVGKPDSKAGQKETNGHRTRTRRPNHR